MILHHVPGATSFEDLRTVNEIVLPTYQEACRMRGLLHDDREWEIILQVAAETSTPQRIRQLFATIVIFCSPPNPSQLFEGQVIAMGEDFRRLHPSTDNGLIRAMVLIDLERRLQRAGLDLSNAHLPPVPDEERRQVALITEQREIQSLPLVIRDNRKSR